MAPGVCSFNQPIGGQNVCLDRIDVLDSVGNDSVNHESTRAVRERVSVFLAVIGSAGRKARGQHRSYKTTVTLTY
jgi:hypothetical protein